MQSASFYHERHSHPLTYLPKRTIDRIQSRQSAHVDRLIAFRSPRCKYTDEVLSLTGSPPTPRPAIASSCFALWFFFYASFTLLTPPLLDDADSVHAEVAREMLVRHDWTTLYANGIRYLEKAPLLYWSMAASFKVFGVHTAAARLPLAFTVLALALAIEAFARRAFRSARAGLYAALILLSSFGIFIFTRITIPDAMVCLWLTLALLCYWSPSKRPATKLGAPRPDFRTWVLRLPPILRSRTPRCLCWGFAACCALNVLTKGLIGIVFPVLIVLAHLAADARHSRNPHPPPPALSPSRASSSSSPSPRRGTSSSPCQPQPGRPRPPRLQPRPLVRPRPNRRQRPRLALVLLRQRAGAPLPEPARPPRLRYRPARALLGPAARLADAVERLSFQGRRHCPLGEIPAPPAARRTAEHPPPPRPLGSVPMLFFSFSTRQEYYVLPALPALVLLIAAWLNDEADEAESFAVPNRLVVAGQRISLRYSSSAPSPHSPPDSSS